MDRYQWFMSNVFGWKFDWLPGEIEDFSQSIQHSLLKQFHHCPLYNISINYLFIYFTPPKPCVLLNRLPYYVILISSLRDCKIHKFCIFDFLIRITQRSKSLCVLISSRVSNIYFAIDLICCFTIWYRRRWQLWILNLYVEALCQRKTVDKTSFQR